MVPSFAAVILGGPADGPSGSGTLAVFHCKAKAGASGRRRSALQDVVVSGLGDKLHAAPLAGVTTQGAKLAVGAAQASAAVTQPTPEPSSQPPTAVPTPTFEPTVVRRPTRAPESSTDSSGAGAGVPWMMILPVLGVVVIGGAVFATTRRRS